MTRNQHKPWAFKRNNGEYGMDDTGKTASGAPIGRGNQDKYYVFKRGNYAPQKDIAYDFKSYRYPMGF